MQHKLILATLFVLTPLLIGAATVHAAKVINPNAPDSNTNIKFQPNPQTQAINGLNEQINQMQARLTYLDQSLKAANARIDELVTTVTAQGTTIINMNQSMQQNNSSINEIVNCGSSGRVFTGSRCISAPR